MYRKYYRPFPKCFGYILCIFSLLCGLVNYKISNEVVVDMYFNAYGNLVLFIIGAIAGIFGTLSFSEVIHSNWVMYIGRRTLYVYGIHVVFIELIDKIMIKCGFSFPITFGFLIKGIIVLALTLLTEPIYAWHYAKVKSKFQKK